MTSVTELCLVTFIVERTVLIFFLGRFSVKETCILDDKGLATITHAMINSSALQKTALEDGSETSAGTECSCPKLEMSKLS